MRVLVNGDQHELADGETVAELMQSLGAPGNGGVAVALDGEVVRRSDWGGTRLYHGARIEVVVAVQGG